MKEYTTHCYKFVLDWMNYLGPKGLTMVGFIIQNTVLILVLRAAAIVSRDTSDEYLSSTVVVFTELVKLILSTALAYYVDAQGKWDLFLDIIAKGFLDNGVDVLKLCLPAILYAIQNNLQYVIETAPLFMVLYQSKIVTTAIFFSFMLNKRLSIKEWCAVVMLTIGVSMVESSQHEILPHHASNIIGMLSVALACITSGFAGVYYEKVLKTSTSSIWVLNIQLSMMSFSFCSIIAMTENPEEIIKYGVFKGFNIFVFVTIILQAMTGLGVALVVKYSDNLYKGFCSSIAIVIACAVDAVTFQYTELNATFSLGALLVILSTIAFNYISAPSHSHGPAAVGVGGVVSQPMPSLLPMTISTTQHDH